jgi:hypothetical protein
MPFEELVEAADLFLSENGIFARNHSFRKISWLYDR